MMLMGIIGMYAQGFSYIEFFAGERGNFVA